MPLPSFLAKPIFHLIYTCMRRKEGATVSPIRRKVKMVDATRKQATISFERAPAELLGSAGTGAEALTRTFDHAAIALANEMVGGAQALLDSAVAYAGTQRHAGLDR